VPELDSARPVFVDPSGRRGRALRMIAAAAATVTVGYLALLLLAVFGAPLPPAAELPLPPGLGTDAAANGTQPTDGEPPPAPATTDDQVSSTSQPRTATAPSQTTAPSAQPAPASSTPGRRSSRPAEPPTGPPGQSKIPTTPPGHN
jgi:cytoskeletal protein RodZ